MSILVTGDTHGDIRRLGNRKLKVTLDGQQPDYVIILGDFGLIWSTDPANPEERYWLKWLEGKPWDTLIIPGNHENYDRIQAFPKVQRYGDLAYRIGDRVCIACHGSIYTIEGRRFFAFGGASSIDRAWRREGKSWWSGEIPADSDFQRAKESLRACAGSVDFVLSHTAPHELVEFLEKQGKLLDGPKFHDPVVEMLDELLPLLDTEMLQRWFCGHFHCEARATGTTSGIDYQVLYTRMVWVP